MRARNNTITNINGRMSMMLQSLSNEQEELLAGDVMLAGDEQPTIDAPAPIKKKKGLTAKV
jgi:hypothetical protein